MIALSMSEPQTPSIWTKISYDLEPAGEAAAGDSAEPAGSGRDWTGFWKWRRPLLDVIGTLGWTYAVLKVFVADIDTEVLGSAASYRFFVFVALVLVLAIVLGSKWAILGGFAYLVFFPAVVVGWKIPKMLGKTRSAVVFLAAANAVTLLVSDIKRAIVSAGLVVFCGLAIAVSHAARLLALVGTRGTKARRHHEFGISPPLRPSFGLRGLPH